MNQLLIGRKPIKVKKQIDRKSYIMHKKMEYIELIFFFAREVNYFFFKKKKYRTDLIHSRGCTFISPCYRTLTQYSIMHAFFFFL